MADNNNKELTIEEQLAKSKADFETLKTAAKEEIERLEKENKAAKEEIENLTGDVEVLKEEIADIKKKGSNKKEAPAKALTPKEKGYTSISDIPKFAKQAKDNAPEKAK